MTKQQEKLLENFIRREVRKSLNEEVNFQDEDFLWRVLKTSGPKISKAIHNLERKYRNDDSVYKQLNDISRGWNELAFGYGDLYHKLKKGK